jgi:hypothetical protein
MSCEAKIGEPVHEPKACCKCEKPVFININDHIIERLVSSGQVVRDLVVKQLVDKEIADRTALVIKAFTKVKALQNDLNLIKPKPLGFDENGQAVVHNERTGGASCKPLFSEEQNNQRNNIKTEISKYEDALEDALRFEDCCYDKLRNLIK